MGRLAIARWAGRSPLAASCRAWAAPPRALRRLGHLAGWPRHAGPAVGHPAWAGMLSAAGPCAPMGCFSFSAELAILSNMVEVCKPVLNQIKMSNQFC